MAEGNQDPRKRWSTALREFLPRYIDEHPALRRAGRSASLILHGSTTMGIDDEWSDLDLWLLVGGDSLKQLDAASPTRFFEFECEGKKGHLNACAAEEFRASIGRCDMDAIYQLRNAEVITDGGGAADGLVALARKPMPADVREAFVMWHYTEMRGEHRAVDNPIERRDPVAVLLSLPKALGHALRAAMVLEGEPYPYDKWLYRAALQTPTGKLLEPAVRSVLECLASGALSIGGPERTHPLSRELRVIRQVLIEAARGKGLDRPWLDKWWLYMDQAREAVARARWK